MKETSIYVTLKEASAMTGIGVNKLRAISNVDDCNYVLFVGKKRMFNRVKLIEFLERVGTI